jgi:hypothetical protein
LITPLQSIPPLFPLLVRPVGWENPQKTSNSSNLVTGSPARPPDLRVCVSLPL